MKRFFSVCAIAGTLLSAHVAAAEQPAVARPARSQMSASQSTAPKASLGNRIKAALSPKAAAAKTNEVQFKPAAGMRAGDFVTVASGTTKVPFKTVSQAGLADRSKVSWRTARSNVNVTVTKGFAKVPDGWQPDGTRNHFGFGPKSQTEKAHPHQLVDLPKGARVTGSTKLPWATAAKLGLVSKNPAGLGNNTPKTVNVWTVEHVGVPKGALKPSARERMNNWMQGSSNRTPSSPASPSRH